jgi:hypothetical protein
LNPIEKKNKDIPAVNQDITINDCESDERFVTNISPPDSSSLKNKNELIIKKNNPIILVKSINLSLEIDVLATSLKTKRMLLKFGINKFIICFT